jgi:hypothetical protein
VLCDDAFLGALCSLRAPGFDIAAPRRYNTIMRIGTAAWTIALGGLCIIAPSDALGPADLLSGVATVEAAPIDPSKDPVYICPMDPD